PPQKVMTAKAECERIDVVKNVWSKVFQRFYQSEIRAADSVLGIKRERKASKLDHGRGAIAGAFGFRADYENVIMAPLQLTNEVERTVDHAIDLRQKHLSDDRDSHVRSPKCRSAPLS